MGRSDKSEENGAKEETPLLRKKNQPQKGKGTVSFAPDTAGGEPASSPSSSLKRSRSINPSLNQFDNLNGYLASLLDEDLIASILKEDEAKTRFISEYVERGFIDFVITSPDGTKHFPILDAICGFITQKYGSISGQPDTQCRYGKELEPVYKQLAHYYHKPITTHLGQLACSFFCLPCYCGAHCLTKDKKLQRGFDVYRILCHQLTQHSKDSELYKQVKTALQKYLTPPVADLVLAYFATSETATQKVKEKTKGEFQSLRDLIFDQLTNNFTFGMNSSLAKKSYRIVIEIAEENKTYRLCISDNYELSEDIDNGEEERMNGTSNLGLSLDKRGNISELIILDNQCHHSKSSVDIATLGKNEDDVESTSSSEQLLPT